MQVVADIEETFLPLPDDLLVNLADSRAVVEALLDALPQMFAGNHTVRSPAFPCQILESTACCCQQTHAKRLPGFPGHQEVFAGFSGLVLSAVYIAELMRELHPGACSPVEADLAMACCRLRALLVRRCKQHTQ